MMLNQSLFGKAPETLDAIDADFSLLELVSVINIQMLVTAEHQGILTNPLVRIHNRSPSDFLHRISQERLSRSIRYNAH
jgi:hypothetical protein